MRKRQRFLTSTIDYAALRAGELLEERTFMFGVNAKKAFNKLAAKQFGQPEDALREIVANAMDKYVGKKQTARIEIQLNSEYFEVTDFGAGFTDEDLECLRTLGKSNKRGKKDYIGRFGIGFASLFNPELHITQVQIDTTLNGLETRLEFDPTKDGVPLTEYALIGGSKCRTTVRGYFSNLSDDMLLELEKSLKQKTSRMNAEIVLNGKEIDGRYFFAVKAPFRHTYEGETTGRINFLQDEHRQKHELVLCSQNIPVTVRTPSILSPHHRLLRVSNIAGTINNSSLNVIASRDDFLKDATYEQVMHQASLDMRKRLRELCAQTNGSNYDLAEVLRQTFICDYNNTLRNYKPGTVRDSSAKALAAAKIFKCWYRDDLLSLDDLYNEAKKRGHLLIASNEEATRLLSLQQYDGPIVNLQNFDVLRLSELPIYSLDTLFTADGRINEKFFNLLEEKKILDTSKLVPAIQEVQEKDLVVNEQHFIADLSTMMNGQHVKEVLRNKGLDRTYNICFVNVTPPELVTGYSAMFDLLFVNRNNPSIRKYLEYKEGHSVPYFIPTLALEMTQNVLLRHGNPCYDESSDLSTQLACAIAAQINEPYQLAWRDAIPKSHQHRRRKD